MTNKDSKKVISVTLVYVFFIGIGNFIVNKMSIFDKTDCYMIGVCFSLGLLGLAIVYLSLDNLDKLK